MQPLSSQKSPLPATPAAATRPPTAAETSRTRTSPSAALPAAAIGRALVPLDARVAVALQLTPVRVKGARLGGTVTRLRVSATDLFPVPGAVALVDVAVAAGVDVAARGPADGGAVAGGARPADRARPAIGADARCGRAATVVLDVRRLRPVVAANNGARPPVAVNVGALPGLRIGACAWVVGLAR